MAIVLVRMFAIAQLVGMAVYAIKVSISVYVLI